MTAQRCLTLQRGIVATWQVQRGAVPSAVPALSVSVSVPAAGRETLSSVSCLPAYLLQSSS